MLKSKNSSKKGNSLGISRFISQPVNPFSKISFRAFAGEPGYQVGAFSTATVTIVVALKQNKISKPYWKVRKLFTFMTIMCGIIK